jgi:thymidylate synthase
LKHFEAVANWNEWTTKQKAKQLVMSFDGEALKLLGEFSEEVLADYGKVVAELNRRYDPAERAQAWKIEFRNRIRRANESIIQLAQALRRLALKAFPNMRASAQEQWVLDQFSLGLGSVEI